MRSTGRRPRWRTRSRGGSRRSACRPPPAAARPTRRARPARGARPCGARAASARARSPGSISSRRRTRPSALETTLCAITSTSPSPRSLRRGRSDQSREIVARPDRRERGERADAERGQAEACAVGAVHAPARSSWRSAPRVEGAWPRRPSSAAASSARSAGVSTSSARPGTSSTRYGTLRRLGGRHMAREAVRAERRLDRVRRREHERVRAGAVAIGHDHESAGALDQGGHLARAGAAACRPARAARARIRPRARGGSRSARPRDWPA